MILTQVNELIYRMYQAGKANAKMKTLLKQDIGQMVRQAAAANFRQQYLMSTILVAGKKVSVSNESPDYWFYSPLLTVKRFDLTEPTINGMRRADMTGYDLYRLPRNSHFTNLYPVADGCGNQEVGEITQVSPAEENFYQSPKFNLFQFFVVKGKGLNIYHLPPCVNAIDIETTYDNEDVDITTDIAFEVSTEVLQKIFGINKETGQSQLRLQEEFKNRQPV